MQTVYWWFPRVSMPQPLGVKKLRLEDDTVMSTGIHADVDNSTSHLFRIRNVCYIISKAGTAGPDHYQEGLSNLTLKRSHSASSVTSFRLQKASAGSVVCLILADFFADSNYKRIFLASQIYTDAYVQLENTCLNIPFFIWFKRVLHVSPHETKIKQWP